MICLEFRKATIKSIWKLDRPQDKGNESKWKMLSEIEKEHHIRLEFLIISVKNWRNINRDLFSGMTYDHVIPIHFSRSSFQQHSLTVCQLWCYMLCIIFSNMMYAASVVVGASLKAKKLWFVRISMKSEVKIYTYGRTKSISNTFFVHVFNNSNSNNAWSFFTNAFQTLKLG